MPACGAKGAQRSPKHGQSSQVFQRVKVMDIVTYMRFFRVEIVHVVSSVNVQTRSAQVDVGVTRN